MLLSVLYYTLLHTCVVLMNSTLPYLNKEQEHCWDYDLGITLSYCMFSISFMYSGNSIDFEPSVIQPATHPQYICIIFL